MSDPKEILDDRKYTKDHEWALESGGKVRVGITAFAVEQLGDITLVEYEVSEGDEVAAGDRFGTIESVKTLSDLFAPVSGKVTALNRALDESPELVNDDCWGRGWMLELEPTGDGDLLEPEAYRELVDETD